jgi:hypothetical protein
MTYTPVDVIPYPVSGHIHHSIENDQQPRHCGQGIVGVAPG